MNQPVVKIVWFRNDLRIHDNPALIKALSTAKFVIPVYIFDPRQTATNDWGFSKTGVFRLRFLLESVKELKLNLKQIGADLVIRSGYPEKIIPELCTQYNVKTVYFHKEVAPEETAVELAIEKQLLKAEVNFKDAWGSTLFQKKDLPFSIPRMPDVFADFRKKIERESKVELPLESPSSISFPSGIEVGELPALSDLTSETYFHDDRDLNNFIGGETQALKHLHDYVWVNQDVRHYHDTRNGLLGKNFSSKLSPWLSLGCISPRKIYSEIKAFESNVEANKSTHWLIFELMWRDFFRFSMEKYNGKYFRITGIRDKSSMELSSDRRKFLQWSEGRTGNDFIDASMQELNCTGFMSNRARQVVASFFVHDMGMNWLMGAAYFENKLIDYDVCSNYCNWAYVAGVGNDPRPDRYFDVSKQARVYDPKGEFRKFWSRNEELYAA